MNPRTRRKRNPSDLTRLELMIRKVFSKNTALAQDAYDNHTVRLNSTRVANALNVKPR